VLQREEASCPPQVGHKWVPRADQGTDPSPPLPLLLCTSHLWSFPPMMTVHHHPPALPPSDGGDHGVKKGMEEESFSFANLACAG
jgi:hypothetical protein